MHPDKSLPCSWVLQSKLAYLNSTWLRTLLYVFNLILLRAPMGNIKQILCSDCHYSLWGLPTFITYKEKIIVWSGPTISV